MNRKVRFPYLLAVSVVAFLVLSNAAQAQDQPNVSDYIDPASAYHTGNIDYIDVFNQRLALNIPLVVDHSQRGNLNFTYSVRYASTTVWYARDNGNGSYTWMPVNDIIGSPQFSMDGNLHEGLATSFNTCGPGSGGSGWCYANFARDEIGSTHFVGTTSGSPYIQESADGTGIRFDVNGGFLVNPQGVRFGQLDANLVTYVQDPNGNLLSFACSDQYHDCSAPSYTRTMTDSVSRVWTYNAGSTNVTGCPAGAVKSDVWDIPGPNGQTRQFQLCYSNVQISTNFQVQGVIENRSTQQLMTAVVLPNGNMWQFDYDNYGDLLHVYLPTAGYMSYGWTTLPGPERAIISRTRFDGTNSATWTYNGTTVTDPLLNDTVYTPEAQSLGTTVACDNNIAQAKYYQGSSSSGTLLETLIYTHQILDNPFPADEGGSCAVSSLQTSVETQLPNGATNNVTRRYDFNFTFTDDNDINGTQHTGNYGTLTSTASYDYGSNAPGALLSSVVNSPQASSNPNYLPGNFLSLFSAETIRDGSGTQMAQTSLGYDENNGSPQCLCGNLTSATRWLNTGGTSPKTQYIYNANGMQTTMIDPNGNTTQYAYDGTGAFLSSIQYPTTGNVQHTVGLTHDSNTGLALSYTDQNSQMTYYKNYDTMLRPAEIDYPDGGQTTISYSDTYPFNTTTTKKITASVNNVTTYIFDGLGRLTNTQSSSGQGTIYVDRTYDANGRLYSVTNPHYNTSSTTDGISIYSYDALNRLLMITEPGGNTITSSYIADGNRLLIQQNDEAGDTTNTWMDGLGRTNQVNLFPNSVARTQYSYDALNNLTRVDESGSNWSNDRIRTFTYDSLSRLTSGTNPESGTETYTYDANGNLTRKTVPQPNQANPSVTTNIYYCYDALNRELFVSYTVSCPSYSSTDWVRGWFYDVPFDPYYAQDYTNPIGRVTDEQSYDSRSDNYSSDDFGYDALGRIVYDSTSLPQSYKVANNDWDYEQFYTYDLAGDLISGSIIGINGGRFSYSYDSAMRLMGVTSNMTDSQHPAALANIDPTVGYWPTGGVRVMTLGNGLAETKVYNNRLQPCRMNLNSSGTYLASCTDSIPNGNKQDFSYGYSTNWNNGNVWSWAASGNQNFNRSYTYDGINRISTMSASSDPSGCTGLSWTYDAWGNRTDQTVTSGTCNTFHVSVNTNNQLVGTPYQYDAAGNLINDGIHTYTYDPEHRVIAVDGGTTTYQYDAEGRRVETIKSGVWTDYYHGLGTRVTAEISPAGYGTRYAYSGNRLLAEYTNGTSGSTYFIHPDHLGSTRLMTTYSQTQGQNQQVYDSMDYLPFGEQIGGSSGTTHKFTGQERDSESGNDNFGARHYGSRMGRFLSPDDPFADQDPGNPQSWNLYSYVRNNPLRNVDLDGHTCIQNPDTGEFSTVDDGGGSCAEAEDPAQQNFSSTTVNGCEGAGALACLAFGISDLTSAPSLSDMAVHEMAYAGLADLAITAGRGAVGLLTGAATRTLIGQVSREALESAASQGGETVRVVTRLSGAPQAGRALSVAVGEGAGAVAKAARPGGTTYVANLPKALVDLMVNSGLAFRSITSMGGATAQEIRFLPEATQFIIRFFRAVP